MPDQEEADRNRDLAAGAVLNDRFVERQRARREYIKLHLLRRVRRSRGDSRRRQHARRNSQGAETFRQPYRHVILPYVDLDGRCVFGPNAL
jgi:hypothetical protein